MCLCVFVSPAVTLKLLGLIGTVEETAFEELHSHHSKDEHEQHVDNEDVQHILQRVHHTVKDSLKIDKTEKRHIQIQPESKPKTRPQNTNQYFKI